MKTLNNIILATIAMALIMTGCDREKNLMLSMEDQIAVQGMQEAYRSATEANENLQNAIQSSDSFHVRTYDSAFHYYHRSFRQHHSRYTHGDFHDHLHDGQGAPLMHGMMGNRSVSRKRHYVLDHELMDKLLLDHDLMVH